EGFAPPGGVARRGWRLTGGGGRPGAPPAVVLGCGALENRRRRARGIDLTRDNPVEQLPYRRIFADRCFELAPHPEGGDPEHLVHQVAASALGQRALLLDVRAVLGELVDQLLGALAAGGLGADDRYLPALTRSE